MEVKVESRIVENGGFQSIQCPPSFDPNSFIPLPFVAFRDRMHRFLIVLSCK